MLAASPVKFPDAWKAPPLILKVNPDPPEAVAEILPSVAPEPDELLVVPFTVIVTPLHGFGGASLPPLLLQELIKIKFETTTEKVKMFKQSFIQVYFGLIDFLKIK